MTLDIVEKLRRELTMATFATPADLFEALNAERRQAADEIERLREDCAEDRQRLDWLERKTVQVRNPMRYGSKEIFWASLDIEEEATDLRQKIDKARAAE